MSITAIIAPFIAGCLLCGLGAGAAYVLRVNYNNFEIAEERGAAGLLLTAAIGSVLLALMAVSIGLYTVFVYWLPHH